MLQNTSPLLCKNKDSQFRTYEDIEPCETHTPSKLQP